MSEELVKKVQEMVREETWTRAAISNYTVNSLKELAAVLDEARNANCENEIKEICDEQLSHTKDSIIALYISGMIALEQGTLDNSALFTLVDIFDNNHKESLVEYLCQSILEKDPQNKFALRKLADFYKSTNNNEIWNLYERIVKLDFEEADIAKKLAERYESQENIEAAISYYKKALLRYIGAKNEKAVKEIWTKLVSLIPEEIDFFLLVQRKVAKQISEDRSAYLMEELYKYYKQVSKWDTAIDILKLILSIDGKNSDARKELIECYRGKYSDHAHLEDYIISSSLTGSYRNVFEAISDFEKHIAFDAKNFVFHRSWGVGIIRKIQGDVLTINFGKKNGIHEMSLKMAVNALQPLAKDHIWVLKATKTKEELANMVKNDISWALKTIIKSFDNKCDDKRIKAELVPSVLSAGEWTSWHNKAQKILSSDSTFGVSPNDINIYVVRDHEVSNEEKLSNEFKAEKQFFARIDILMRYLKDEDTDKNDELFADMFNYFAGFLKAFSTVTDQTVASYLIVQKVTEMSSSFVSPAKFTFAELYGEIENPREMYLSLKDTKNTELKADFLKNIKLLPDWDTQFIRMFPTVLKKEILDTLIASGKQDKVQKLAVTAFENYRDYRECAIYMFRECAEEDWFKAAGIPVERQLVTLVNIIALCFREINNHVNTTENKKIIKAACVLLFEDKEKGNVILNFMLANGQEACTRLYTMVNDVKDLEGRYKAQLRSGILKEYPTFKFQETETKTEAPKGLMVTAAMLEVKKAQVTDLVENLIPANTIDVSEARAKGDLKENAEYSAAKEKEHMLNATLKRLKEEIERAVIFDPTTLTTSMISFGTTAVLHNEIENKDEEISIFGPWESNPDKGIISYLSPFGNELLDAKVGEKLDFVINEHAYSYTVKEIKPAVIK